jgi:hypothetical protein
MTGEPLEDADSAADAGAQRCAGSDRSIAGAAPTLRLGAKRGGYRGGPVAGSRRDRSAAAPCVAVRSITLRIACW